MANRLDFEIDSELETGLIEGVQRVAVVRLRVAAGRLAIGGPIIAKFSVIETHFSRWFCPKA
jgi:hypothetical protein